MTKRNWTKKKALHADSPLKFGDHKRPVSRRDFIRQGFSFGSAAVMAPTLLGLFANPLEAKAALSSDLESLLMFVVLIGVAALYHQSRCHANHFGHSLPK